MREERNLVVIPAYNEEATIEEVVMRAKKYADVCVINDNSSDATPEILNGIGGIHVIHHEKNTHIPGGLLDGMKHAIDHGYNYMITMDAGLSHNPDEIPRFISHPPSDLAIGTRVIKKNIPLNRRCLSKVGNFIYNVCLDFPACVFRRRYYKDISSGFRRYSREAMKLILSRNIESKSFDILFETAMYVYKNKMIISEVPITYDFSNSSLNAGVVKDCIKICLQNIFSPKRQV